MINYEMIVSVVADYERKDLWRDLYGFKKSMENVKLQLDLEGDLSR